MITQCLASETKADFYFLCQAFMASFHNGHTEFYDRWLFPDGSQFEGIGILPHHRVHPTISSLKTGKDPVFHKGIGIMKQQLCA